MICRSKGEKDSNPGQLYGCLRCWNRRRSIPVGDNTVALFWDDQGISWRINSIATRVTYLQEPVALVKGRRILMSSSLNNWLFHWVSPQARAAESLHLVAAGVPSTESVGAEGS